MKIDLQIYYTTFPGQQLIVSGSIPKLGNGDVSRGKHMILAKAESGCWQLSFDLDPERDFTYRYHVKDENFGTYLEEWGPDRIFRIENRTGKCLLLTDHWRAMSDPEYALHSSAFSNAILKPCTMYEPSLVKPGKKEGSVINRFKPNIIRIKPGHRISVSGSLKSMGAWNYGKAIALGNMDYPVWSGEVRVSVKDFPVRYKYLIKDENGILAFWEKSQDRIAHLPEENLPDVIEINDDKFDFPQYPWKGTGVAIPVFSLRRKNGYGVGEFTDIKLLVDWAAGVGIRMVQILPVNDTVAKHTWQDSYPCAAISVYALHPIYINLIRNRQAGFKDQPADY